jgi:hypothetical protein
MVSLELHAQGRGLDSGFELCVLIFEFLVTNFAFLVLGFLSARPTNKNNKNALHGVLGEDQGTANRGRNAAILTSVFLI